MLISILSVNIRKRTCKGSGMTCLMCGLRGCRTCERLHCIICRPLIPSGGGWRYVPREDLWEVKYELEELGGPGFLFHCPLHGHTWVYAGDIHTNTYIFMHILLRIKGTCVYMPANSNAYSAKARGASGRHGAFKVGMRHMCTCSHQPGQLRWLGTLSPENPQHVRDTPNREWGTRNDILVPMAWLHVRLST